METLHISGKLYVSSRQLAKEHRYHSDYIGQLIRSGKVKGQKVGRTWYVEENSFKEYLKGGAPASQSSARADDSENAREKNSGAVRISIGDESAPRARSHSSAVKGHPLLTYIREEPIEFPILMRSAKKAHHEEPIAIRKIEQEAEAEKERPSNERPRLHSESFSRTAKPRQRRGRILLLLILGVGIGALCIVGGVLLALYLPATLVAL